MYFGSHAARILRDKYKIHLCILLDGTALVRYYPSGMYPSNKKQTMQLIAEELQKPMKAVSEDENNNNDL